MRWREDECEQERVKNDSFSMVVLREDEGKLERVISTHSCWWWPGRWREDEGEQNESFLTCSGCWWPLRWREDKCEQERVRNDLFLLVVAREDEGEQNELFLTLSGCW